MKLYKNALDSGEEKIKGFSPEARKANSLLRFKPDVITVLNLGGNDVEVFKKDPDAYKKKAKELFYKVLKNNDISVENLIKSVYIFNKQNKNKEMKYIPHPTTWLNQERGETVEEEKASINLNQLVG